jgi:uncharacterized cupredoxin-like copper-binding protein
MTGRAPLWFGLGLVVAGLIILGLGAVATGPRAGNLGGPGSMMGGQTSGSVPAPDSPGFVPGTAASPRIIRIAATPQLRFVPDAVTVKRGETITLEVTTMGPLTHEFMVGPSADVAADTPGTPEIADLGMMDTGSLTYTFDGPGPYAFACHATGHFEAGMAGTVVVVP